MVRDTAVVDVDSMPDLARLAREVRRTEKPVTLRDHGEEVAVIVPAGRKAPRRPRGKRITQEDIDAALSTFGAWKDTVDAEKLKRELDEARSDNRPPIEL